MDVYIQNDNVSHILSLSLIVHVTQRDTTEPEVFLGCGALVVLRRSRQRGEHQRGPNCSAGLAGEYF